MFTVYYNSQTNKHKLTTVGRENNCVARDPSDSSYEYSLYSLNSLENFRYRTRPERAAVHSRVIVTGRCLLVLDRSRLGSRVYVKTTLLHFRPFVVAGCLLVGAYLARLVAAVAVHMERCMVLLYRACVSCLALPDSPHSSKLERSRGTACHSRLPDSHTWCSSGNGSGRYIPYFVCNYL